MVILNFIFCIAPLVVACVFHKELPKIWIFTLSMAFTSNMMVVLKLLVESP